MLLDSLTAACTVVDIKLTAPPCFCARRQHVRAWQCCPWQVQWLAPSWPVHSDCWRDLKWPAWRPQWEEACSASLEETSSNAGRTNEWSCSFGNSTLTTNTSMCSNAPAPYCTTLVFTPHRAERCCSSLNTTALNRLVLYKKKLFPKNVHLV